MGPDKLHQALREFRAPILIEAVQDLVHAFSARSEIADYASWGISLAVIAYLGWIGAARARLRPLLCGIAGLALFIASFVFSNAIELIVHPVANPYTGFAAALFVAFFISPLAFVVALLGVGVARLSGKSPGPAR
jgi:hypothetical protein